MKMKLGIVGLPNAGKSTVFNALTNAHAECAKYPFSTIEPNVGAVPVPDERMETLGRMFNPGKVTPTTIEFVDIAGLVKGASRGEGLGNKFLSHIREVDAVIHVVRCFEDSSIPHVEGSIDPVRDIEIVNLELAFADLESLERKIERTQKMLKSGDKKYKIEIDLYERIKAILEKGLPARSLKPDEEEKLLMDQLFLLTSKPVLYAANLSENDLADPMGSQFFVKIREFAAREGSEVIAISAKIEEEIARLNDSEKDEFLSVLGIKESGLNRLIKAGYRLLDLVSFFTMNQKEIRAWTITRGTKAPQAAGKVHSDFERGFIRAEIIPYEQLVACGSYAAAKEKGLVRLEGRDYVMQDGDIALFRFNV